jgi:molecular chaperone GrpE
MTDKEHEVPVKVVDRRWWANPEGSSTSQNATVDSRKPTYVEQLEQQVAEKDRIAQEFIAKYRQAASEFDEARLRLRREVSKDIERTRREVISEFLEVLDNLDRALDSAPASSSSDALLQGVEMTHRQFLAKLEALGVTRIDAVSKPFDPRLHEAISRVPATSPDQDGLIVGVVRHGYRIGDEVLRPAAVAVASVGTNA